MCEFKIVLERIGSDIWVNSRLRMIAELVEGENNRILDLGCGPGYADSLLSRENEVISSDIDRASISRLEGRRIIVDARCAPFKKGVFDYVICTDVLEHILEDGDVLDNIHRLLRKDGKAIITLPAYSSLYGTHDKYIGHYRRYDRGSFIQFAREKGFRIEFVRYTNSLMFPMFLFSNIFLNQTKTYRGKSGIERRIVPLLDLVCRIEKRLKMPFGIGLMFVLKRRG